MPSKYATKAYRLDPAIVRVLARLKAHGRFLDYNEVFVALVTSYLLHRHLPVPTGRAPHGQPAFLLPAPQRVDAARKQFGRLADAKKTGLGLAPAPGGMVHVERAYLGLRRAEPRFT